jgi:hypothetical protein
VLPGLQGKKVPSARRRSLSVDDEGLLLFLVSLLTLTLFAGLFVLRALDDNRLTSWQWVFDGTDLRLVFLSLVVGVCFAQAFSRATLRWPNPAILLFVSSFAVAGFFWRLPEVNIDAARYFIQAKSLEQFGVGYFVEEWGREIGAWTDLPLVPFLYGLVLSVFGEMRIAIQAFTTLLFSGTVVLTYLIGRTLWNEIVGGCAAVLLLGMPYLLTQVPLMLSDVPAMFFLTLAVYASIGAVRHGGAGFLVLAPVAITLAMLSRYSNWVLLSVVPVIFLTHLEAGLKPLARRAAVVSLSAGLLAGGLILGMYDVVAEQVTLLQSYQLPALSRWGESHISTFFFQLHPFIAVAAAVSVFVAVTKRDYSYAIVCWMPLVLLALGAERIRYLLVAFPMLALMAAYAVAEIGNARVRRHVVSCTLAAMLVTAAFAYLPFLQRTSAVNLQQAGELLDTIASDHVEVFALPQTRSAVNPAIAVPILDIYTDKTVALHADAMTAPRPRFVETSPVRFTWDYDSAKHYSARDGGGPRGEATVVVISADSDQPLPEALKRRIAGHRLSGEFTSTDRVFRYKTIVKVYEPLQRRPEMARVVNGGEVSR